MNEWLFLKDWVNCKYNEMKSNLISRESIHVYSDLSCYMYSVFDLILWRLSCRPCTVEKVSIQPSGVEPWVHLFSQNLCNYHPWSCGWYLFFLCESVCVSSWHVLETPVVGGTTTKAVLTTLTHVYMVVCGLIWSKLCNILSKLRCFERPIMALSFLSGVALLWYLLIEWWTLCTEKLWLKP